MFQYFSIGCLGGLFNRSATVHIGDSHTVTIQQEFSGRDVYHYFKATVFVTGSLPQLANDAQVEIGEFQEEYRRVGPGIEFENFFKSVSLCDCIFLKVIFRNSEVLLE